MKKLIALGTVLVLSACIYAPEFTDPIEGPKTRDPNVFAKAFLDEMQARTFEANKEFCGLFGRDEDGYIIATPPVLGDYDSCLPPDEPTGFNVFASYHSHGAFDPTVDSEVPSSTDIVADRDEGLIGFISTPGGRIWRTWGEAAHLVCGRNCISADPEFEPGLYGPVRSRYTLFQIRQREAGY